MQEAEEVPKLGGVKNVRNLQRPIIYIVQADLVVVVKAEGMELKVIYDSCYHLQMGLVFEFIPRNKLASETTVVLIVYAELDGRSVIAMSVC